MIDEILSLLQPLYTCLMLILLGYFVYGITKRDLDHTDFPENCTVIYKPERTIEEKYIFDHDDPWRETARRGIPITNGTPEYNRDHRDIEKQIKDNNVV